MKDILLKAASHKPNLQDLIQNSQKITITSQFIYLPLGKKNFIHFALYAFINYCLFLK